MHRAIMGLFATLVLAAPLCAEEPSSDAQIEKLIEQLGAEDFDKREEAEGNLHVIGYRALSALEKAAKESTDQEVRLRLARLIGYTVCEQRLHKSVEELTAGNPPASMATIDFLVDECSKNPKALEFLQTYKAKDEYGQRLLQAFLKYVAGPSNKPSEAPGP